ncbi:HIT family protein [Pediococcus argentinicus]|uniref:HIT family protein n=1 Tax=Pediococcus argentinicus TaxID=480391 RepID=UPI00338FDB21
MTKDCLICQRILMIKDGNNPYFVKELETGYVVIGDTQYFKGYTLFLSKEHYTELHLMEPELKNKFLIEMSWVSEACSKAFHADKMNVELLGNGDSHTHWHIFPRHDGDTPQPGPIWWVDPEVMYADDTAPDAVELENAKLQLNDVLNEVIAKYN